MYAAFASGWRGFVGALESLAVALAYGWVWLLLLAAAVAVMLFFLYGCVAGAAYSPRGRLVFIPLAQVSGGVQLP